MDVERDSQNMTASTTSNVGQCNKPQPKTDMVFRERHHLSIDKEMEYPRSGSDPGRIIIINQQDFDDKEKSRSGSTRDVNELVTCFQRLGYNINIQDIYTNLNVKDVFETISKVLGEKDRLMRTNCFILVILSHGDVANYVDCTDGNCKLADVINPLKDCPELKDKPKMIIIQACKGNSKTFTADSLDIQAELDKPIILSEDMYNPGPDILMAFSTIEGNVSYRSSITGSWYIQELCKVFTAYGKRDDVLTLLSRINKHICGNYYDEASSTGAVVVKQMPVYMSTLKKKFYLNRNKDRHYILEIQKKTETSYNMLREITTTIVYNESDK